MALRAGPLPPRVQGDPPTALVPPDVPPDGHGRLPALLSHLHRAVLHLCQRVGPQGGLLYAVGGDLVSVFCSLFNAAFLCCLD